jgi:hypothetical protein
VNTENEMSKSMQSIMQQVGEVKAMLQGAAALLYEAEPLPDPHGEIFSARGLVEMASKKVGQIIELQAQS